MLVVNFYLIIFFIKIAKKRQIVAIGNNKNLHEGIIPRGAGIVFGFIYLFSIAMAFRENYITSDIFFPIILGSFLCLLLGFVDDVYDLKILVKFSFQFLIIFLLVFYFFNPSLFENNFILNFISIMLITFLAIWTLNAYNFIDGADGHLGSVAFMQGFLLMISLNMHKNFDRYLKDKWGLTEAQVEQLAVAIRTKQVKKGEYLLREGATTRSRGGMTSSVYVLLRLILPHSCSPA